MDIPSLSSLLPSAPLLGELPTGALDATGALVAAPTGAVVTSSGDPVAIALKDIQDRLANSEKNQATILEALQQIYDVISAGGAGAAAPAAAAEEEEEELPAAEEEEDYEQGGGGYTRRRTRSNRKRSSRRYTHKSNH